MNFEVFKYIYRQQKKRIANNWKEIPCIISAHKKFLSFFSHASVSNNNQYQQYSINTSAIMQTAWMTQAHIIFLYLIELELIADRKNSADESSKPHTFFIIKTKFNFLMQKMTTRKFHSNLSNSFVVHSDKRHFHLKSKEITNNHIF